MTKRKRGIYSHWFEVLGFDMHGQETVFLIRYFHAKTYAQAIEYWNKTFGKYNKAELLRNANPYNKTYYKKMYSAC